MSSNETFDTDIVDISEFFTSGDSSSFNEKKSESKSTVNEIDSPIKELKAIILSLDWEITDEIADSFVSEVDYLLDVWKADKTVLSFLQILRALGKYLRTHKADAHPESIHLLYSVYNNFEKIVLTDEISADQERQIFKEELGKFNKLKEKIALAAVAASEGKANEHLLSALKTILLEIDWQITDQTMQKFNIEITKLEQIWSADKNFLTPLQMMRAIGSYINKNKHNSHPDSIKLLSTVFQHFEQMALSEDMSPEKQQALIQSDLERFTHLKSQILSSKIPLQSDLLIDDEDGAAETIEATEITKDLPAQAHEYDASDADIDFGYVEPIGFDSESQGPSDTLSDVTEGAALEVDQRLNNLFAEDDTTSPAGERPPLPLSSEADEVDGRLNDLFSENDHGIPSDSTNLPPLPDTDENMPLPTGGEDRFVDLGESSGSLPPGQMSDDLFQAQEAISTDSITPLPDTQPHVEPLPEVIPEEKTHFEKAPHRAKQEKDIASHASNLLSILARVKTPAQLEVTSLNKEIQTLEDTVESSGHAILLQIIRSMVTYIEKTGKSAHPDSLVMLRSTCQKIVEGETEKAEQGDDELISMVQPIISQYLAFQDSIIFPAISKFSSKENEIKKILGLSS